MKSMKTTCTDESWKLKKKVELAAIVEHQEEEHSFRVIMNDGRIAREFNNILLGSLVFEAFFQFCIIGRTNLLCHSLLDEREVYTR
jgi:hypothetical protein